MKLRAMESKWHAFIDGLRSRSDVETAGVILAERLRGGKVLLVRDLIEIPEEGYLIRRGDQIRLDPVMLNRLTRPARDGGLSVITVHTHPGTTHAWFSEADNAGDARLMPSLLNQMPGPHGSMVIAGDTGNGIGRVWTNEGGPFPLELRLVGKLLKSTAPDERQPGEPSWFSRQDLALGDAGQTILRNLHVGVVGLGGTGSVAFCQLAHLGIRRITVVDGDLVEPTNVCPCANSNTGRWGSKALYPWRHPIAVWRTLLGRNTDELIQNGVLKPTRLESVAGAENPAAGRVLSAHPLSDGEYYGVSQTDEMPSRTLSATDLDGFELMPEKLRLYLRSRLGIGNGGSVWAGNEILDLGFVELGVHKIHMVYALRQPATGVGDHMRAHSGGALSVSLIPACETYKSELASVPLDSALPTKKDVIRGAIIACSLAESIPAIYRCPDDARLVVDTRLKKVWIDDVELTGLQPDLQPFRFVEAMARSQGPVSSEQLSSTLSPGRLDGNTTARQAKNQVKKIITAAMSGAGRSFDDDPFPSAGQGSYRCAFPAYVV